MNAQASSRQGAERHPLKDRFLRWQCRVRQIAMREAMGRPGEGVVASLTLPGEAEPMGQVITVLSKAWAYSKTPELQHIARRTNDPAQRREQALALLSETWFQRPEEFGDTLTASFPPGSPGAARIAAAGACRLSFAAYSQRFELACAVGPASPYLREATWWHNLLFNPNLDKAAVILAFKPDWDASAAEPPA